MKDLIAPMAEELNRALGIDKDTLENELKQLIQDFKVPAGEAKRSLLKKYRKKEDSGGDENSRDLKPLQYDAGAPQADEGLFKQLKDIRNGDTGITVIVNVIDPQYREITTQNDKTAVIEGMLEDATARVHFTSWVDIPDIFSIRSIVIRNAYVKSFQGMPNVNISESSVLEEYQGDIPGYVTRKCDLSELVDSDGAYNIEVEGDMISIRPGSGIIERCPVCSRVMQKGQCRAHGKLNGVRDLRIKAVIDDGTGSMICVLDRDLTQKLIGKGIDEFSADDPDTLNELIRSKLIGYPFVVKGNVTSGDFGKILVAASISMPAEETGKLARALMGELQ
ncbi:single-stranded DNA-binding protein [Methanocella sp. CWC-04]|uniref:Single-stranded DNA-binding protein n=1 Tax=Methanooceanicella nereidis TaxID=2052831 RepID=A0AAP2RFF9_9EURY|nr:single-stranded DNA-binding protein [Methanocella sp. CWC-04]MCD1295610.1 single-stranded DNA-binding protein [Methanocella sp. CWC-04]